MSLTLTGFQRFGFNAYLMRLKVLGTKGRAVRDKGGASRYKRASFRSAG